MSPHEGRRRWVDPRDGQSYSVHCRPPGTWLFGRHRGRPADPSQHWQVLFYPDAGGPVLVAEAGSNRVDVETLDDQSLAEWLDKARP
ncbi:MAG: hypothetical protein P8170_25110 [Gemmatimonadota bacterium]